MGPPKKRPKTATAGAEPQKREERLPKILNREDAQRFVSAPNVRTRLGLRNRVALQLMYGCGLRESEVSNLTVDDVLLSERRLRIQAGKGGKDRVVAMTPDTIAICAQWMERRPESDWFVCTLKGTQVNTSQWRALCLDISDKLGIHVRDGRNRKRVQPHILRHSWATHRLRDGANLYLISQNLGHKHLSTTEVYLHVDADELVDALASMPDMVPAREGKKAPVGV